MLSSNDVSECLAQAFHEVLSTEPVMIDILVMNRFASLILEKGAGAMYTRMVDMAQDISGLEAIISNMQSLQTHSGDH